MNRFLDKVGREIGYVPIDCVSGTNLNFATFQVVPDANLSLQGDTDSDVELQVKMPGGVFESLPIDLSTFPHNVPLLVEVRAVPSNLFTGRKRLMMFLGVTRKTEAGWRT